MVIDLDLAVAQLVEKQLIDYNYTFPTGHKVSSVFFIKLKLTFFQMSSLTFVPMRTRPYRNSCLISVIRDLYFTGGTTSFAHRFRRQFPFHESDDGNVVREMSIPMVSLVATAVSTSIFHNNFVLTC